ncbi:hypothetical protein [Paraliomyxa miuraensis]|uniref:hypothetical protein n=1 Tax=Paraliomyxa miuraensis TaxID=376150 RepID=UPI00224CD5F1|nr:hypothetical protein [Paraliomyxa miuraensis]MCX4247199.1 hypothetical protein [Paraliomyxa miuraensis]
MTPPRSAPAPCWCSAFGRPLAAAWLGAAISLTSACGRTPFDGIGEGAFLADDAGSDALTDSSPAGDSLEDQDIRVFSEAYEGSIVRLDFTIDSEATCDRITPGYFECAPPETWYVSLELIGRNAAPGVWYEPDFSFWNAENTIDPSDIAICAYSGATRGLLDSMILTIDRIGPDGVSGRVDHMEITVYDHPPISGSFRSVPCN